MKRRKIDELQWNTPISRSFRSGKNNRKSIFVVNLYVHASSDLSSPRRSEVDLGATVYVGYMFKQKPRDRLEPPEFSTQCPFKRYMFAVPFKAIMMFQGKGEFTPFRNPLIPLILPSVQKC